MHARRFWWDIVYVRFFSVPFPNSGRHSENEGGSPVDLRRQKQRVYDIYNFELAISQCLTDFTLIVCLVVPEISSDTWQGIVVAQQSPPLFLRREAG